MSFINNIPRGLRVMAVMAILGVLIWQLAVGTNYYYYTIGAAVLLTLGAIELVYRPFKFSNSHKVTKKARPNETRVETPETVDEQSAPDVIEIETDYTDTPSILRAKPAAPFRETTAKPLASDPGRNRRSPSMPKTEGAQLLTSPIAKTPSTDKVDSPATAMETAFISETEAPSIPLVDDETTLTEEDKNQLVNAVWYRCENPYCKYTSFLGVHHIIEEKEGGSNQLDNLIVLCPYCHDLAHRKEIPEKEMRDWISNRENRFKFKPDWKYF